MAKQTLTKKPHSTTLWLGIGLLAGSLIALSAVADPQQEQVITSPTQQTTLLELYTSQGCYSCPPAEKWLNRLVDHDKLWSNVVPVAFHVDYWDYLGWKDPYAEEQNQVRHYGFKSQGLTKAIYTPEMIANGHDWPLWRKQPTDAFISSKQAGVLKLTIKDNKVLISFARIERSKKNEENKESEPNDDRTLSNREPAQKLRAHIALLGFGLQHNITSGENKDKMLEHEFVALAQDSALSLGDNNNRFIWTLDLPTSSHQAERLALIGWVDSEKNNRPLQATGDWLSP